MQSQHEERRKHRRVPVNYEVTVRDSFARVAARGHTENVSDGGFLLICKHHEYIPRKGRLHVAVSVPNEKGNGFHLERHACYIAHVRERSNGELALGIQFLEGDKRGFASPG